MQRALPLLVVTLLGALPATAHADFLRWFLVDVTFVDGATATGWFDYNADGDVYTALGDFDISVTGGTTPGFPDFRYTPLSAPGSFADSLVPANVFGFVFRSDVTLPDETSLNRELRLFPAVLPTAAGGTLDLIILPPGSGIQNSLECYNCNPFRNMLTGQISAVPLPASAWLLLSGTGLLLRIRCRRGRPLQAT